jgi:hypothetical protein
MSELSDLDEGLHLGKVMSGGDLGDSVGVSVTLPDMSSCGGERSALDDSGSLLRSTAGEV